MYICLELFTTCIYVHYTRPLLPINFLICKQYWLVSMTKYTHSKRLGMYAKLWYVYVYRRITLCTYVYKLRRYIHTYIGIGDCLYTVHTHMGIRYL